MKFLFYFTCLVSSLAGASELVGHGGKEEVREPQRQGVEYRSTSLYSCPQVPQELSNPTATDEEDGECRVIKGPVMGGKELSDAFPLWTSVKPNGQKGTPSWSEKLENMNNWLGRYFYYNWKRVSQLSHGRRSASDGKGNPENKDKSEDKDKPEEVKGIEPFTPEKLYNMNSGACLDLAHFTKSILERMRLSEVEANSIKYVKIEFSDVADFSISKVKYHWMTSFKVDGKYYFTGDTKCPGRTYGPFDSVSQFQLCYDKFRDPREIDKIELLDFYGTKKRPAPVE